MEDHRIIEILRKKNAEKKNCLQKIRRLRNIWTSVSIFFHGSFKKKTWRKPENCPSQAAGPASSFAFGSPCRGSHSSGWSKSKAINHTSEKPLGDHTKYHPLFGGHAPIRKSVSGMVYSWLYWLQLAMDYLPVFGSEITAIMYPEP